MKLVYFGHGKFGYVCLKSILRSGFTVCSVWTHPEETGPERGPAGETVAGLARDHGIPVMIVQEKGDLPLVKVNEAQADLGVSVTWRRIFPKDWIAAFPMGMINLHGSLLPKYRGNAPVTWALINGEREVGATVHRIDEGVDTGDIICQRRLAVSDHDTVGTLFRRMEALDADLIVEALNRLVDDPQTGAPQDHAAATVGKKRRPEDGRIDWRQPSRRVFNWIRALAAPLPGAFSRINELTLTIWEADCIETDRVLGKPGEVLGWSVGTTSPANVGMLVAAGTGAILVRNVSRTRQSGNELAKLRDINAVEKGDRFE